MLMTVPRARAYIHPTMPTFEIGLLNGAGTMDSRLVFSRASSATDSIYTDAAGSVYNTYLTDVPRMTASGYLHEGSRVNRLLVSTVPATQTTASLATGTYTLWVIGTGSATSAAVTATGTGFGAATAGVPNVFVLTGAGTVRVTVAGSLNRFQLELGSFPSSFIVTAGAVVTRSADLCAMSMNPDGAFTIVVDYIDNASSDATARFVYDFTDAATPVERTGSNNSNNSYPSALIRNDAANVSVVSLWGAVTPGYGLMISTGLSANNGNLCGANNNVVSGMKWPKRASTGLVNLIIGAIQTNGTQSAYGYFRRVRFWRNRYFGNTQLMSLTKPLRG